MLDVTTMSRTLDRLEKQGLIERKGIPAAESLSDQSDRCRPDESGRGKRRICKAGGDAF